MSCDLTDGVSQKDTSVSIMLATAFIGCETPPMKKDIGSIEDVLDLIALPELRGICNFATINPKQNTRFPDLVAVIGQFQRVAGEHFRRQLAECAKRRRGITDDFYLSQRAYSIGSPGVT